MRLFLMRLERAHCLSGIFPANESVRVALRLGLFMGGVPCGAAMRTKKAWKTAKLTFKQDGCSDIICLYKYVFYGRNKVTMLNIAVCDDSDVFLQEAEAVLRRDARIGEIRLYHTLEQLLKDVHDREKGIDLVIMDIEFDTQKNGLTAAEEICRVRPQIHIIYVTGFIDRYAQHILLSQVNLAGYLTKPLDSDLLTCYLDKIYRASSLKSFFTLSTEDFSILTRLFTKSLLMQEWFKVCLVSAGVLTMLRWRDGGVS